MIEETKKLIKYLSESNFKLLIVNYLKVYYNTPHVRIVDGPYDGGNDIEIIVGNNEIRKNIQITTQENNWHKKLWKDCAKSQNNVNKYSYLNVLDFYISQPVSKQTKNELQKKAELEYGIQLNVNDAISLANEAEEYSIIKNTLFELLDINNNKKIFNIDSETKLVYDLLNENYELAAVKSKLVDAYIFSFLYENEPSTYDEVYEGLNNIFNNKFDKRFFRDRLNNLKSCGDVTSESDNITFILSSSNRSKIRSIDTKGKLQEKELKLIINRVLDNHDIEDNVDNLILKLKTLFKENYEIDINEINNNASSFSSSIKKTYNDLILYFIDKGIANDKASTITKELLKATSENEYVFKLTTTVLFTNLYNQDKLEEYLNIEKQYVLLDTQILLRMLCLLHHGDNTYEEIKDSNLRITSSFVNTARQNLQFVDLITSADYIDETSNHILQAYQLSTLMSIKFFNDYGDSNNVYFQYYKYLQKYSNYKKTFLELLNDILGLDLIPNERNIKLTINSRVSNLLDKLGVHEESHDYYANFHEVKREYEIVLANNNISKSGNILDNDVRTIIFLSNKDYHVDNDGYIKKPSLITWDRSFYNYRESAHKKFLSAVDWHIYTPNKFAERLALSKFSLDPKTINYNIISLAEENFSYDIGSVSLMDTIMQLFNKNDLKDRDLIHKLADLEDQAKNTAETFDENEFTSTKPSPVGSVLSDAISYYQSNRSKYTIYDFRKFLEESEVDESFKVIKKHVENMVNNNYDKKKFYSDFDKLIYELIEE